METVNQSYDLLSTQHHFKDLIVDDMGVLSMPAPWECKENNTKAPRKHRSPLSGGGSPQSHSSFSPVRTALSENGSTTERAPSPSVSAKWRRVLPEPQVLPAPTVLSPHDSLFTSQITPGLGISATSYFSPIPPSMPLYIVPLPPNPSATAAQIKKNICSQHQSKVKVRNKTGRRIAQHLLYSILKNLPINTENVDVEAVGVKIAVEVKEPEIYPRSNRNVATQAFSKYGSNRCNHLASRNAILFATVIKRFWISETYFVLLDLCLSKPSLYIFFTFSYSVDQTIRKCLTDEVNECSSSESSDGYEWAGAVRALRNSHARLVLRQLRHLCDIERLSRALYREYAHE